MRVLRSGKVRLLTGAASQGTSRESAADQLGAGRDRRRDGRHRQRHRDGGRHVGQPPSPPTRVSPSISRRSACAKKSSSSRRICWRRRSTISSSTRNAPSCAAYRRWARASPLLASASIGIAGLWPKRSGAGRDPLLCARAATYCNGTHIGKIATCHVRILNYVVAHDAGRLINPLIVDGQIQGGVAHRRRQRAVRSDELQHRGLTTTFGDLLRSRPTCRR